MSLPVYASVPSLNAYQFSFLGQTFGMGANGVNWKEIDGLDIEGIRTGDSAMPRDSGEFAGWDFLAGRDITLKFDCQNTGATTLQQNMSVMSTVMLPAGRTEAPLYLNLPYFGTLAVMARPRNRSWKIDVPYALGNLAQDMTALFHATDPRFYVVPITQAAANYAGTSLVDSDGSNAVNVTNIGNWDCKPRITITGPTTTNDYSVSIPGSLITFSAAAALNASDTVVIDLYYKTITFTPATTYGGFTVGIPIPWSFNLSTPPPWFTLAPGATVVTFSGGAAGSSIEMDWTSVWVL